MSEPDPTRLLHSFAKGDAAAAEQLLPLVYDELHQRARHMMQDRQAGHTLEPKALIHEAFLRLVDQDDLQPESHVHFARIAAQAMRYVLTDHAKAGDDQERGGGQRPVTVDEGAVGATARSEDVLAIDDALTLLAAVDEQLARIVELRFFGGLEHQEIAAALDVELLTVDRGWRVARAWLANAIETEGREP